MKALKYGGGRRISDEDLLKYGAPDIRVDTANMLHVAAGILSDNAHVLYGGSENYDTFVAQMFERAVELRAYALSVSPTANIQSKQSK